MRPSVMVQPTLPLRFVNADAFVEDVTPATMGRLVDDPRTAAVAAVHEADLDVAGRTTNASAFTNRKGSVGWTITDGRMPRRGGEIALGARLARSLDATVGSHVPVFSRAGRRELLDVVGIGSGPDTANSQFANGAVVSRDDLARIGLTEPFTGAAIVYRAGVDPERASASIGRDLELVRPVRPADLDNLDQLGRLPALLVAVLGLLVLAVLFHVLVTLVRRRRNEFATLRAVGLRPGQLARTVVVTALVFAAVGVAIGAPFGFVIARFAWRVTQDALYMESAVVSPVVVVLGVAAVAFVASVLVAAWPAWSVVHRRGTVRSEAA
jgi:predicted lysophospholipase L1 biosynthesis ABC-type transport system permease subunit